MSLKLQTFDPVPDETSRVATAINTAPQRVASLAVWAGRTIMAVVVVVLRSVVVGRKSLSVEQTGRAW